MKGDRWRRRASLLLSVALALGACGADDSTREERVPGGSENPRSQPTPVASEVVIGYSGPGEQPFGVTLRTPEAPSSVHRTIGRRTFELALRARPLAQYPCTSCHAGPLVTSTRPEDAHQDVQPVHPSEFADDCGVCHARNDVYQLRLQGGTTVPLDQAYRLCGQCHNTVVEAWAGGAHGKRLDGWRGERVVMGCADCHEPHAPEVPKRVPFRGPTLPSPATSPEGGSHGP